MLSLFSGNRSGTALAPSEAYAPLACLLASIVVTETTHLIAIRFFEHHVTVRTELFVIRDARSADVEKAHHVLLCCWVVYERGRAAERVTSSHEVCLGGSVSGLPKNASAPYRAIRRSSMSSWLAIVARESALMKIVRVEKLSPMVFIRACTC
jgi:hypothetical protein